MCEYRFSYPDSSIFYITTDVWSGSRINFQNRDRAGYDIYRRDKPSDTLVVSGQMQSKKFWKEQIMGNYAYGYSNADKDKKKLFDQSGKSILLSAQ